MYPNDLEKDEIVPFNAKRDAMSPYWWVPNTEDYGISRWRSRRQLSNLNKYRLSGEFEKDYQMWIKRKNFASID